MELFCLIKIVYLLTFAELISCDTLTQNIEVLKYILSEVNKPTVSSRSAENCSLPFESSHSAYQMTEVDKLIEDYLHELESNAFFAKLEKVMKVH